MNVMTNRHRQFFDSINTIPIKKIILYDGDIKNNRMFLIS